MPAQQDPVVAKSRIGRALPAGTVVAWGDDTYGQTAVPPGLTGVIDVAAGQFHSLALKSDGTVVAWGRDDHGQATIPPGLTNVVAIATHRNTNLALKSDGTVVAWGSNNNGQATIPPGLDDVIAIAAGSTHSLALRDDGTVVAWGSNLLGQTDIPAGLTNVVAIDAGGFHSAALTSDGTVIAWGWNRNGETSVPACLPPAVAVTCGRYTTFVILAGRTAFGWGSNQNGELIIPSTCGVTKLSGGAYHLLAITGSGGLVSWGVDSDGQRDVPPGLANVIDAAAGFYHSLAVVGATGGAATTTTLTVSPNPSLFHQPVTLTATVAPALPGTSTPTGAVAFFVDAFAVDVIPINLAGTASTTVPGAETGEHPVFAIYYGDPVFAGSESSLGTMRVNAGGTTITLNSAPNPSNVGQSVTLTATVNATPPTGGIPTGAVTFTADSAVLATVPLDYRGIATITTSSLAAGTHTLGAAFVDSFRYTDSTAPTITQQVNP